jgi:hypothetical protein
MASSFSNPSFLDFLIAVVLAAGLALLVFRHADRHGSRHATAWGLCTFLAAAITIPAYLITYWLSRNRRSP